MLGQAKICFILRSGSDEESPVYCHSEEQRDEESDWISLRFFTSFRMTFVFSCHSEEQRDEESDCNFFEILRYAQNDICFFLSF